MPESFLKLIKRCTEWRPRTDIEKLPRNIRGIYSLLNYKGNKKYDVVYVGMAGGKAGIGKRLRSHRRGGKSKLWTHFSMFEVWDNIRNDELRELEGFIRAIYRRDTQANRLNRQRGFKMLKKTAISDLRKWKVS